MSRTIKIYNTVNTNELRTLIDSVYTISWGDGTPDTELAMPTVYDTDLPYATHTYLVDGDYNIEITVTSPWKVEKLKRIITIPLEDYELPTDLGRLCFEIPYSDPTWYQSQNYLQDYRLLTGNTNDNDIYFNTGETTGHMVQFLAVGKSRLDEFQLYGTSGVLSGVTFGVDGGGSYTGYTIDLLSYRDYDDGYTHITGDTGNYPDEEFYQGMITRDEHLIGFLDTPQISSDIFVERGRQGVMERNLRLGEIDSTGELTIYGSGYFKIRKQ